MYTKYQCQTLSEVTQIKVLNSGKDELCFEFVTLPSESRLIFINMQVVHMPLLSKTEHLRRKKKREKIGNCIRTCPFWVPMINEMEMLMQLRSGHITWKFRK